MNDINELAADLRRVPFFSELEDAPLEELAKAVRVKEFGRGEMIFFEDDACDGFYYVKSGSVKIYKVSSGGREQILHSFRSGETFAEVPTFDNGLCPANAQAIEDSTLFLIRKADFERITREFPEVAFGLLHHFAGWLRAFTVRVEELSLKDVAARLAGYLLNLAEKHGEETTEGIAIVLEESQHDMASRIGTVREIISRNVRRFQDEGLISLKGRRLVILDPEGLRELT